MARRPTKMSGNKNPSKTSGLFDGDPSFPFPAPAPEPSPEPEPAPRPVKPGRFEDIPRCPTGYRYDKARNECVPIDTNDDDDDPSRTIDEAFSGWDAFIAEVLQYIEDQASDDIDRVYLAQELRELQDLFEQYEAGEITAPSLNDNGMLVFEHWPERTDA